MLYVNIPAPGVPGAVAKHDMAEAAPAAPVVHTTQPFHPSFLASPRMHQLPGNAGLI